MNERRLENQIPMNKMGRDLTRLDSILGPHKLGHETGNIN